MKHTRLYCALSICLFAAGFATAAEHNGPGEPVSAMFLGVYHLNNPGHDIHNTHSDDVLTPKRQSELAALADQVAKFHPTVIADEQVAPDQDTLVDNQYQSFTPDWLATRRDEIVQIAYRIGKQVGLRTVYAIDEREHDGQPDYFPYDELKQFAVEHGQTNILDAANASMTLASESLQAEIAHETIGHVLARINDPSAILGVGQQRHFMYPLLAVAKADSLPGAELNGRWYLRNAKIFAKLMRVVKPGDRVVIVFGSGHSFWLRHFIANTEGYQLVEPTRYIH